MRSRIGIYSGTFDPIHQGHITFAVAAIESCKLDKVIFLPEHTPRGKRTATDISHRTALIERALRNSSSLHVLSLPVEQFTVENTLPQLRSLFKDAQLTFLMGSDVVLTFPWENLDTLLTEASLAIGMRASDNMETIVNKIAALEERYNVGIDCEYIQTPEADLTSSGIRNGTADMSRLPHPSMLEYIREYALYPES